MVTLARVAPLLAAILGLAWGASASAGQQPPVDYQEPPPDPPGVGEIQHAVPGQLPGSVPDRVVGPGPYERLPAIDESQFVVLAVRKTPYWKAGTRDAVLTDACRLGDFASVPLNRMVVQFTAPEGPAALQVVLPTHRHLLIDRRRLAQPSEVYFFHDAGLPDCEVWVDKPAVARKLGAGGSSLPPRDPQALAKKKQLIQSWPKQ